MTREACAADCQAERAVRPVVGLLVRVHQLAQSLPTESVAERAWWHLGVHVTVDDEERLLVDRGRQRVVRRVRMKLWIHQEVF